MKTTETTPLQQDKIQVLEEHVAVLEQQLDWFKRQLFGRKSEKHLLDEVSAQGSLFATDKTSPSIDTTTDIKAHKRKSNKQLNGDEVNDTGLRFDASVPTKVIDIPAPELQGEDRNLDGQPLAPFNNNKNLTKHPSFNGKRLAKCI